MLQQEEAIGPALPLRCPNHPDRFSFISTPEEFEARAGDGGCTLQVSGLLAGFHSKAWLHGGRRLLGAGARMLGTKEDANDRNPAFLQDIPTLKHESQRTVGPSTNRPRLCLDSSHIF
jgi:hypothetical protein